MAGLTPWAKWLILLRYIMILWSTVPLPPMLESFSLFSWITKIVPNVLGSSLLLMVFLPGFGGCYFSRLLARKQMGGKKTDIKIMLLNLAESPVSRHSLSDFALPASWEILWLWFPHWSSTFQSAHAEHKLQIRLPTIAQNAYSFNDGSLKWKICFES